MVFVYPLEKKKAATANVLEIDLGVENLATIVTTTGSKPMLVKGKMIKAINQYYNKRKAHNIGILRQGKKSHEGAHTSARLERLHLKRHRRIKDLFHKVSRHIVQLAVEQQIGTIVIGHNDGWKQASAIGRRNNQSFCHIPHQTFVRMIQFKAAEQGIAVTLTEEAYTSKASFLDQDPLPRYDEEGIWLFSGKRIHRGLSEVSMDDTSETPTSAEATASVSGGSIHNGENSKTNDGKEGAEHYAISPSWQ